MVSETKNDLLIFRKVDLLELNDIQIEKTDSGAYTPLYAAGIAVYMALAAYNHNNHHSMTKNIGN